MKDLRFQVIRESIQRLNLVGPYASEAASKQTVVSYIHSYARVRQVGRVTFEALLPAGELR